MRKNSRKNFDKKGKLYRHRPPNKEEEDWKGSRRHLGRLASLGPLGARLLRSKIEGSRRRLGGRLLRRKIEKDPGGALGVALRSAPSLPGHWKGALRPTFHTAMKSWKQRSARSAEKTWTESNGRQREATGVNGNGVESEATRNQQEAKATGDNGRQWEATGTEPKSRRPGPILKS